MTNPTSEIQKSSGRGWGISSLVAGILWIVLLIAPTVFTTLMGLPFGIYALVVGWLSRRRAVQAGDRAGARLGGWGVGLGCGGFVYLVMFYVVLGALIAFGAVALIQGLIQGTPVP